jgi:hypothetical protein
MRRGATESGRDSSYLVQTWDLPVGPGRHRLPGVMALAYYSFLSAVPMATG